MGRECGEKHNMKLDKLLFDKDEFLEFWPTKCWLKSRKARKNLLTTMEIHVLANILILHQENFANFLSLRT